MNTDILQLRQLASFNEARIFLTAIELGLFSATGKTWMSSDDIAEKLETSPRGTKILLRSLAGMEIRKAVNLQHNDLQSRTPCTSCRGAPYFFW